MSATNYITNRVQQAVVAYLQSKTLTIASSSIYGGIHRAPADPDEAPVGWTLPYIQVVCQEARCRGDIPFFGNWTATVEIRIRHNADDTEVDDHHLQAGEVLDQILTDTVEEDLSGAYSHFTAQHVRPLEQRWEIQGRSWVSILMFEIECCGSDV